MAVGVVSSEAVVGSIVDLAVPDDVGLLLPFHLTGVVALGVVAGLAIVAALAGSSAGQQAHGRHGDGPQCQGRERQGCRRETHQSCTPSGRALSGAASRPAERRVGTEWVSTCSSRCSLYHSTK